MESPGGPQIYSLQGLDAEAARFRGDILAQVSEAVLAIESDRRVIYLNAAAERQYGVAASEAPGGAASEIFENHWLPPHDDLRRSREAVFTEHLVKPVAVPLLIAAIRRVTETLKDHAH